MRVINEDNLNDVKKHLKKYKKNFPLFLKDIERIESNIAKYSKNYSNIMVSYRQSKSRGHLQKAQEELDKINNLILTLDKIELMALMAKNTSR